MSEIQDWGDESARDGRDAKASGLTDPDDVPKGWRPTASTIRAIQGVAEPGAVGGLSVETGQAQPTLAEKQFDPLSLLDMTSMPVGKFFSLNFDEVYRKLHPLQSLPDDHPEKQRWIRIHSLIEERKEKYLTENPGATEVSFTA